MKSTSTRLVMLSLLMSLPLSACQSSHLITGGRTPELAPNQIPKAITASQKPKALSPLPMGQVNLNIRGNPFAYKKMTNHFKIQGSDFSDPDIRQLRLEVRGSQLNQGAFVQTLNWQPGQQVAFNLQAPTGHNRVLILTALDANGNTVATLMGALDINSGHNVGQVSYFDTLVAQVLMNILSSTSAATLNTLNLDNLRNYIATVTGYNGSNNTYSLIDPLTINTTAIADYVSANQGTMPPQNLPNLTGSGSVQLTLNETGARIAIDDLTSAVVASSADNPTTIASVSPGIWTLTVSKAGFDTLTQQIQVSPSDTPLNLNLTLLPAGSTTPTPTASPTSAPTATATPIPGPTPSWATVTLIAGGYAPTDNTLATNVALSAGYDIDLVVDSQDNLYVSDHDRILKITPAGNTTTVLGGGSSQDYFQFFFNNPTGSILATDLRFYSINGLAIDANDNLYLVHQSAHYISKLDTSTGMVSHVGGNISSGTGFSGDGGPATSAQFNNNNSGALAVDPNGNIFVADTNNHRVRRIDSSTGIVTTVAGSGINGYSGDGGLAVDAKLAQPTGVAVDTNGDLYISDYENNVVRKVTASTGIITTMAGGGHDPAATGVAATSVELHGRMYLLLDGLGNLYVSETEYPYNRVQKINLSSGILTTLAGNGQEGLGGENVQGTSAALSHPEGLGMDSSGNLFFSELRNYLVRKLTPSGILTTFAGGYSGNGTLAQSAPIDTTGGGVVGDSLGNIYFWDQQVLGVRQIDTSGNLSTIAGGGALYQLTDGISATSERLDSDSHMHITPNGTLYIAERWSSRIRKVTGGKIYWIGGNGSSGFTGDGGSAVQASFRQPMGIFALDDGTVYIADKDNNRIRKIAPDGTISTVAGGGSGGDGILATQSALLGPEVIFVDGSGNLYIGENAGCRVRKVDAETSLITTIAGNGSCGFPTAAVPATQSQLYNLSGIYLQGNTLYLSLRLGSVFQVDLTTGLLYQTAALPYVPGQIWEDNNGHLLVEGSSGGGISRLTF